MNAHLHPTEKAGTLRITGGIPTEEKALAIKAALEDLPGVYSVKLTREAAMLYFDPDLASEQQLYEAVKLAGCHASDFIVSPES